MCGFDGAESKTRRSSTELSSIVSTSRFRARAIRPSAVMDARPGFPGETAAAGCGDVETIGLAGAVTPGCGDPGASGLAFAVAEGPGVARGTVSVAGRAGSADAGVLPAESAQQRPSRHTARNALATASVIVREESATRIVAPDAGSRRANP